MTTVTVPAIGSEARRPSEEAAIRGLVGAIERGFNTDDPQLATAPFAANATAVGVDGARASGLGALLAAHRRGPSGPLRDATAHHVLGPITYLGPAVAVAHVRTWSDAAAADEGTPPATIALYVFARSDERWWVVARQTTAVLTSTA